MKYVILVVRLIVAIILLQSLYFKFTGHAEAIHIFSTIGMEPWGRYAVGISELIVSVLLFIPRMTLLAALDVMGLMAGAIGFHLFTPLGIVVRWDGHSDGGQLFIMAVTALVLALIVFLWNMPNDRSELFENLLLRS